MKRSPEKQASLIIEELYSFKRTNKSVIKSVNNTNGTELLVGIYFVSKLRKELKSTYGIAVDDSFIYTTIIKLSRKTSLTSNINN